MQQPHRTGLLFSGGEIFPLPEVAGWKSKRRNSQVIRGVDSIFGGQDFYDDEKGYVGSSFDSVIGNGQDFYDADGNYMGFSVDSVLGNGQNFYGADGKTAYSVDSAIGNGQDIYGSDGMSGFSVDSPFGGGTDYYLDND